MQVYNDELMHYGVLGMRWGHRKGGSTSISSKLSLIKKKTKDNIKATNQMNKDMLLHPVHSTTAQLSLLRKNPRKALFGMDTEAIKELNADVKNRIDKEVEKKKTIKEYRKQINEGASLVEKMYNKVTEADKYEAEMMYALNNKK
jgi:hypothetical protein